MSLKPNSSKAAHLGHLKLHHQAIKRSNLVLKQDYPLWTKWLQTNRQRHSARITKPNHKALCWVRANIRKSSRWKMSTSSMMKSERLMKSYLVWIRKQLNKSLRDSRQSQRLHKCLHRCCWAMRWIMQRWQNRRDEGSKGWKHSKRGWSLWRLLRCRISRRKWNQAPLQNSQSQWPLHMVMDFIKTLKESETTITRITRTIRLWPLAVDVHNPN